MISLKELNSNPIYQPPKEWLIPYKIHKMVQDFFENPILLKDFTKEIDRTFCPEGVLEQENIEYETNTPIEYVTNTPYELRITPKSKKIYDKLKDVLQDEDNKLYKKEHKIFTYYIISWNDTFPYYLRYGYYTYKTFKKGNRLSDLEKEGYTKYSNKGESEVNPKSPLRKYTACFNIIEKEFKIMNDKKRDPHGKQCCKYFHTKPFEQFEENGIEVMFVNSGFSLDGKRKPNFNRGAVENLKQTCKNNKIKGYSKLTKNKLIQILLKL